jgi:hypothetical protein
MNDIGNIITFFKFSSRPVDCDWCHKEIVVVAARIKNKFELLDGVNFMLFERLSSIHAEQ